MQNYFLRILNEVHRGLYGSLNVKHSGIGGHVWAGCFLMVGRQGIHTTLVNKFILNREDITKMKLAEIGCDTGWWIELV
jgi:hypothetical protein